MKQLFLTLFGLLALCFSMQAQESTGGKERITNFQNPLATEHSRDSFEIARFDRRLTQLRSAFEAQDMGKVIENNRFLLLSMRTEIEQLEGKIAAGSATSQANATLSQMKSLLEAFEGHSYDFAKKAEAEKNFERFAAFWDLMRK
ncbi:MAG: hypothetical protein JNM22_11695 [Saprospiraceae bacterium]|nr:hypothetical protein [Saprospiraceae bacterium]